MSTLLIDYSKRKAMLFVAFFLVYEISVYIANDMIMPGMIGVVHEFAASSTMVATSLTAFILGGGSLQLFLGPLSDRFGRRPVLICGASFFFICTLLIAISQTMSQFIMARFFQGMGLCFIGVVGYAVLQEMFEEMDAVRLISLMGNITVVAPLIGPLLGAIIIHYLHWRDIFYIIAVFACLAVFGLWRFMPETVGVNKRDGTQTPIAPLHLLQILKNYRELLVNRRFVFGALSLGVGTIPIIAWIGTSPLILMQGAHFSVIEYGLWQLPIFVSASLGNIVMRFSTYRMALQRIATIGAMVLLLGLALVSLLPSLLPLSYLGVIIGISIYAFGLGFMTAPLNRLTLFSTMIPKGAASALISVILMLCTGVGNQLVGLVYVSENNTYFGLFCGACGLIFLLSYRAMIGKLSELLAA